MGSRSVVGVAPKPHPKKVPGTFFTLRILTPLTLFPTLLTPGNIEVFKDMQIKELDLYNCQRLTGTQVGQSVGADYGGMY